MKPTQRKGESRMERGQILAPLVEHLDPALPEAIQICNFHLHQQRHLLFAFSQFELVFCCEIKSDMTNHFVWKDCHSCWVCHAQHLFFFCLLCFLHTDLMPVPFAMALFTCPHQPETPSEFLLPYLFHSPNSIPTSRNYFDLL